MTSTGTFQGLKDGVRNSSKVLKPPGGGSSDIFGGAPEETSPRRIKNHNHSQLGSTMFGESTNGTDTPRAKPDGNPVTGTGYTGDSENNSAPVQNGNGNVTEKVNGSASTGSASPPAPAAQPRTRVPPGGYSSGLW